MRLYSQITPAERAELVNNYQTALTALDTPLHYQRMVWAANVFAKAHPDVSPTTAYLALERALD